MDKIKPGFILVNKPKDITSYGCVAYIKRVLDKRLKIGHAGTLDPYATGLLIIALNREATRHMNAFLTLDKRYRAEAKLGELTETYDCETVVMQTCPVEHITEQVLRQTIASFGTQYEQTPPFYSALMHEGKRLYELAREGKIPQDALERIVEKKRKMVKLYEMNIVSIDLPFFTIDARVSHGTYIRSLMQDIAVCAGSCATTYALERTEVGPFTLEQAVPLDDIKTAEDVAKHTVSVDDMLAQITG